MLNGIKSGLSAVGTSIYNFVLGKSDEKASKVGIQQIPPEESSSTASLSNRSISSSLSGISEALSNLIGRITSVFTKQIKQEKINSQEIINNPKDCLPLLTKEDLKDPVISKATIEAINKISLPLENKEIILGTISKLPKKDLTPEIRAAIPIMISDFSDEKLRENKDIILTVVAKLQSEDVTKQLDAEIKNLIIPQGQENNHKENLKNISKIPSNLIDISSSLRNCLIENISNKEDPTTYTAILDIAFKATASKESNLPGARVGEPKLEMKSMIKLINALKGTDLERHSFFRHYVDALYNIPEKDKSKLKMIVDDPDSKEDLIQLFNNYPIEKREYLEEHYITFTLDANNKITDLTWKAPF